MATVTKSIVIEAPVEKVFAFMENPMNMLDYWPSMIDVRNLKELDGGKKTFDWTYKMGGMKLDGSTEVREYVPNERVVMVTKGGIESTFNWIYTPVQGGTEMMVRVDYKVPVPVLGRLAEGLIVKQNERELDVLLANVKARLEVHEPVEKS